MYVGLTLLDRCKSIIIEFPVVFLWFGFVLAITYVLLCASQYEFISLGVRSTLTHARIRAFLMNSYFGPNIRKLVILKRCWDISLPYTHYIDQSQLRAHTHARTHKWRMEMLCRNLDSNCVHCFVYSCVHCTKQLCVYRRCVRLQTNMLKWMLYLYFFRVFHSFFLSMVECGCEVVSDFDWAVKQQFKICCKRLA